MVDSQRHSDGRHRLVLERPASPEHAVPRGRIDWSARPGHCTVFSLQHRAVWEEIDRSGAFELRDSLLFDAAEFAPAYAWMRGQMRLQIGVEMGETWPVWGWSRTTRASLVESCRLSAGEVLLRLEVPRDSVLESDFGAWHAALNGAPLCPPEVDPDTADWDVWEGEADGLLSAADPGAIEATWARMFDIPAWGRATHTQVAMPAIRASWVISATPLEPQHGYAWAGELQDEMEGVLVDGGLRGSASPV